MIIQIINKILIILLVSSIINIIKNIFDLVVAVIKEDKDYFLIDKDKYLLVLSISYIIMSLINGVKI